MKNLMTLLFIATLILTGCGNKPKPEIKANKKSTENPQKDTVDAQKMRYVDLKMDSTAVMDMKSWPALTAFNNTILKMKSADTIYSNYGAQLNQELNAMQESIPSRLNTEKIKNRLTIMKKQVGELQKTIKEDPTDREAVAGSAQQFLHNYKDFSTSVRETLTTAGQKMAAPTVQ